MASRSSTRPSRQRLPAQSAKRGTEMPDDGNQVLPFQWDDGTDDLEEIRRRRYSSSASDDSDLGSRSRHAHKNRHRSASRQAESEWEKASNGERESVSSSSSSEDESDREDASNRKPAPSPESPRRMARKQTQQSESASDEEDDYPAKASTVNTATLTASTHSPSTTPRLPLDLASISKLAIFPGSEAALVQGYVLRTKSLLHSQYQFYLHDQLVLMAEKQSTSRTPNYHLFDMTRAATGLSARLSKKSGNYLGKLRSNFTKKKSVLLGNQSRKTELGAIIFSGDVSSSEPRKVAVVLPPLHPKRKEVDGIAVGDEPGTFSILVEHYKAWKKNPTASTKYQPAQVFCNKAPVFENGFYRLNFHGRVSVPSVKNFQLVHAADMEHSPVCLQFGKVDDHKFHLDFRAPMTPIQAFAIALAQLTL